MEEKKTRLIAKRSKKFVQRTIYDETPPFPMEVLVEVANICNHSCVFCAYEKMTRKKGVIDKRIFESIMKQAFKLGARDAGLYGGSEPLACNELETHIETLKKIGYSYVYISTNGSIGDEKRFKRIIDAGVDPIKFSINGCDRSTYKLVHGRDHFYSVIKNITKRINLLVHQEGLKSSSTINCNNSL